MKFYLDQHGCAKNQVDGEEIIARLEAAGHAEVLSSVEAELILVNSCGFIEDAKKESIGAVLSLKAAYPDKKIILAGCLSQRYAEELARDLPEADGIVGNADLGAVLGAVRELEAGGRPVIVPEAAPSIGTVRRKRLLDFPGTAHVKITEGCSNNCAYCAIPIIRGQLRSRPVAEVLAECQDLLSRGIRELVLVGQDLGSYGKELAGRQLLPELFAGLSALPGDFRVRTLYIHPDNFPMDVLPLMARDPRLLPYFDLPFQHASAPILRAMNRRGGAEAYLELIATIRAALPDAVLRSTFLLGFPGESEEDFATLRAFQEAARLDWLGAFIYSREEGTRAYAMKDRVPKKLAAERKKAIEQAQERITRERLQRFVGRELELIVEECLDAPAAGAADEAGAAGSSRDEGGEELFSLARAWLQAPEVDGLTVLRGAYAPGEVLRATVLGVNGVDLEAAPKKKGGSGSAAPKKKGGSGSAALGSSRGGSGSAAAGSSRGGSSSAAAGDDAPGR